MTKDKEIKKIVPPLRFPEFRNSEGWEEKSLSEILDYERPDKYIVKNVNYYSKGIPVLTANKSFILGYTKENYGICNHLPVVIFDDFTLDKKYVDFPFKVKSSAIKILRQKNSNNLKFAYEMMNQIRFEAKEHKRYYISSYQTQKVYVPKSIEQTKIANCLCSLDDLISAVTDKIEILKEHKKGLMQQLFPAEDNTIPALRFPDFQNKKEWVCVQLGQYLLRHPEYGLNAPAVPYSDKLPVYLRITDISDDRKFISAQKVSVDKDVCSDNYLEEGDIVLARTGASVGKSYKYKEQDGKLVFAGFLIRIKPNTEKVNSDFLHQFLSTEKYWRWVNFTSTRSGQPGINRNEYSSMPLQVPIYLDEQKKIADCLSSVDELISTENNKLAQLKAHKKGLMQQLFPSLEDI